MSSEPKVVRWGILATGAISKVFAGDILLDPATRGVTDVRHEVVAVGSRTQEKARAFADSFGLTACKAYGGYDGVFADENVDIVYVGSPNSHHYPNARAALLAGKAVLCEKGFTINASQARDLVAIAQRQNVYLHEALWTRHLPVTIRVQEVISEGTIGKVERVLSEFGMDAKVDEMDPSDRLIDPALGGGAILDVSPYALCWVLVPLFPYPAVPSAPKIASQLTIANGIDVHVGAVISFEGLQGVQAIMTSSMRQVPPHPVIIQGSKGEIRLTGMACCPDGFVLKVHGEKEQTFHFGQPEKGNGLFYEADDAARNLIAGRIESLRQPHATSIAGMAIFDEIRRQAGYSYSDELERVL